MSTYNLGVSENKRYGSKGLSGILRDIRTLTYQICRIDEKINQITIFNK